MYKPAEKSFFQKRTTAYILVTLAVIIWGIGTVVVKATVQTVPPMSFLLLRFWISAIILFPFAIYFHRKYHLNKQRITTILKAAALLSISLILYFQGISRTTSAQASVISSIYPILVTILGFYLLHEIITKRELKGTLIAFIGTLIIILEPILASVLHINGSKLAFLGNILFMFGVLTDALYAVYVKKYVTPDRIITPFMLIVFLFTFLAIIFTPFGLIEQYNSYTDSTNQSKNISICSQNDVDQSIYTDISTCNSQGCYQETAENGYMCRFPQKQISFFDYVKNNFSNYLSTPTLYGILYMAIFSGIIAYTLHIKSLETIEASEASIFNYLQPLVVVPLAMIFLGESISYIFIFGAIIIITGIYLVEKRK